MALHRSLGPVLALALAANAETINGVKLNGWDEPDLTGAEVDTVAIQHWLGYIWVAVFAGVMLYHVARAAVRHLRTLVCLNNDKQNYFKTPNAAFGSFQRYLLDAPLFRVRHKREFRLSSVLNMGVLPTRLQTSFLLAYFALNAVFASINIHWGAPEVLWAAEFRNRVGVLAVMNMIPLFLLSGRNNPLIKLLGITFDTYNMMHRWLGRIVIFEGFAHGISWTVWQVHNFGWPSFVPQVQTNNMVQTGLAATGALLLILLQTPSPVRHAFYETFLHIHIILVAGALGVIWIHLEGLTYLYMLYGVIGIWVFERSYRLTTILYRNVGRQGTKAELELLAGDAVRVTIKMPRPWKFEPGQHVFLYIPVIGWWTSHPFSLAWSEEAEDISFEKEMPMHRHDILALRKTSMSLLIRRRTGFTERLYRRAEAAGPGAKATVTALVEGPYGSQDLGSYGTVLLFACGVGITHQLSHLRRLIDGYANHTTATRRVILVWIIQSPEHLDWIRGWMTSILAMEGRRQVLRILLFVTRPRSTKEIHSPSASVQMFPGKPNVGALVDAEVEKMEGAMCVSVCGTGSLADEVRVATRRWQERRNVAFLENSFSL